LAAQEIAVQGLRKRTKATPLGKPLFPEDVSFYSDPSILNPEESDVWGKTIISKIEELALDESDEKLLWKEDVPAPVGWQTFSVDELENDEPTGEQYQVLISLKAHDILVRAELLRKMGYRVPALKYLKTFELNFPTDATRDDFLQKIVLQTSGLPDRWIKNVRQKTKSINGTTDEIVWEVTSKTKDCRCLQFQDAIAFPSVTHMYNLAFGVVDKSKMQGRRVFESLLIPYGMTAINQSFNLLSWEFGQIINDRIFVDYEFLSEFFPGYSDARWAARKILSLSRQDWKEIMAFGQFPVAVRKLGVEKMISRRNSLIALFSLENEFSPIEDVDTQISHRPDGGDTELRNGRLVRFEWPGYAPQFGFGDPESPITKSEIFAFARSKVYSGIFSNLVNEFNTSFILNQQLTNQINENNYNLLVDALVESHQNKTQFEIPFGFYSIPYAGAHFIASREIVTGQINGSPNPIQMSHTFGYSVKAGNYIGWHGLPDGISANLRGEIYLTRTYSHIQPIKSVRDGLKTPFKNVAVQMVARQMGKSLDDIINGNFDSMHYLPGESRRQKEEQFLEVMNDFSEAFSVGESLILSQYIGGFAALSVGKGLSSITDSLRSIGLGIEARGDMRLISRLHIHRHSEDTIQVYDDKGEVMEVRL
ncbi:MAG: hypothetical protein AAF203_09105, partial [Pseudomonadota bacterium]